VLPFENMSAEPANQFLADGIAEDIITALTQLDGVRVAARTSAFAFRDRKDDLRAIAEDLNVATVLRGSVRRVASRLRVTVQLVSADDGYHMWSERYDRDVADIFAVQDEIASAVARRLRIALVPKAGGLARRPTGNLAAYELFLKGRALLLQRGRHINEAVACFERAIALDDQFGLAYALLGDALARLAWWGGARPLTLMDRAREAASRAQSLSPEFPETHLAVAMCRTFFDFDRDAGTRELGMAVDLSPRDSYLLCQRAIWVHGTMCVNTADALADARSAVAADPLSAFAAATLAHLNIVAGSFAAGVREARRAVQLDSQSVWARIALMIALGWGGEEHDAITVAEETLAMSGRAPFALWALGGLCAKRGDHAGAQAIHEHEELQARSRREYIQPAALAITAASAGRMDEAFDWYDRAIDEHDPLALTILWTEYPTMAPFYADPRGARLRERIGWTQSR
jgi:serine/threonine-protein kinase